jgi:hypothetical protein
MANTNSYRNKGSVYKRTLNKPSNSVCFSAGVWRLLARLVCTLDTYIRTYIRTCRDRGSTVVKVLCYTNRKVAGSIPTGVNGFFIDIKSFRSHYGPGVESASNRNEYQEYFLGVNAAGA